MAGCLEGRQENQCPCAFLTQGEEKELRERKEERKTEAKGNMSKTENVSKKD